MWTKTDMLYLWQYILHCSIFQLATLHFPEKFPLKRSSFSTLHYQTVSTLWGEGTALTESQCGCYHDYLTHTHTHCDNATLFFTPFTPAAAKILKAVWQHHHAPWCTKLASWDVTAFYQNDSTTQAHFSMQLSVSAVWPLIPYNKFDRNKTRCAACLIGDNARFCFETVTRVMLQA